MRLSWAQPEDLVAHELGQSHAEGKDVAEVRAAWLAAGGSTEPTRDGASAQPAAAEIRRAAEVMLTRLDDLPAPSHPDEPDTLAEIARPWPDRVDLPAADRIVDRIEGAWFGRAAGCLLGKPVEKLPPEGIRAILESEGRWPLRFYFTAEGLPSDVAARWPWNRRSGPTSLVENIDGMPEDDDLNFPIMNLALLESAGRGFTTDDVALAWLANLPAGRVFTAERAAYRNLLAGIDPGRCAQVRNPFREWIGALIRADVYGWVTPGDPYTAARLAFTDARLSHTRNGIYGAMWVAGMSAAAVVADDIDVVLETGLAVVPPDSRLARAVQFGARLGRDARALDDDLRALWAEFDGLHWVHVLNNAATIAWALARSAGQFELAVPLAVMAGWDTDSAGATVGAITGALAGHDALPRAWLNPLRNRIASSLPGLNQVAIDGLAARTVALANRS